MDGGGPDTGRDEVLEALFEPRATADRLEPRVTADRLDAVEAARGAAVDRVIVLTGALRRRDAELADLRLRVEALERRQDEERESLWRLLRGLRGDISSLEKRLGAVADTIVRAVLGP